MCDEEVLPEVGKFYREREVNVEDTCGGWAMVTGQSVTRRRGQRNHPALSRFECGSFSTKKMGTQ